MENQTEMEIKTPPKIHAHAYHICRAWYNGSYTMATKPIKFLELHYTNTPFLIICDREREWRSMQCALVKKRMAAAPVRL